MPLLERVLLRVEIVDDEGRYEEDVGLEIELVDEEDGTEGTSIS